MLLKDECFDSKTHQNVPNPERIPSASWGRHLLPSYRGFSPHSQINLYVRVWGRMRLKEGIWVMGSECSEKRSWDGIWNDAACLSLEDGRLFCIVVWCGRRGEWSLKKVVLERLIVVRCLYCGNALLLVFLAWRWSWHPSCPKEVSSEAAQRSAMSFGSLDVVFVLTFSADSCEMTLFIHKDKKVNGFS